MTGRRASGLAALVAAALVAAPGPTPVELERVIIVLADDGARSSTLAAARAPSIGLDERHGRVVRALRGIHDRSLRRVEPALTAARASAALVELDRLWIVNAIVAEVDPAWIDRLAADPGVARVVPDRRLRLGGGDVVGSTAATPTVPVEELVRIRVPEVWSDGVTGQGAIVANVDSGVNGEDDTMRDRWRGLFAGSEATWFAPVSLTVFPEDDFSIGSGHGTATMGILTGGEETFGVAFGATWMAGDAFEGGEGWVSNVLKIYQWLIDPDGDPSTRSDVPDVVNNSFGLTNLDDEGQLVCDPIFNAAIDALEAAGAIVVWSAGNQGTQGVTAPANRADSPVNAFAVGSVDAQDRVVASSGRGPSPCGGPNATKPEVVAPGDRVTSRNLFNQFTIVSGTSFATPMAAGILALMRSKNPTITPEAAKTILLETARDIEVQGEDNASGRGIVDAAAALARVSRPAAPLARLVGFRREPLAAAAGKLAPAGIEDALVPRPGGRLTLLPELVNHGPAIPASSATLASSTPGVTVSGGPVALDPAGPAERIAPTPGGGAFEVALDAGLPPGTDVVLDLQVQGAAIGPFRIVLEAGDPAPGAFATHDANQVRLTVTNFGGLGFYTGIHGSGFVLAGDGFRFPASGPNWLFHAGLMAGVAPDRLSDEIPYGEDTQNSTDWIPLAGSGLAIDPVAGGQRITARYDDRRAIRPLGLEVRQESYAFDAPGEDRFVIVQYAVRNASAATLGGLRLGLFADWDLPDAGGAPAETIDWDPQRRLGIAAGTLAGQPQVGVAVLDDVALARLTFAALERDAIVGTAAARAPRPAAAPDAFGGEFSDAEKWSALASGQTRTRIPTPTDAWQIIGVGPITLAAGAADTLTVALLAGSDRASLAAAAEAARETYFRRVLGVEPPPPEEAPPAVELAQNFPNPFLAGQSTTIPFGLPDATEGGGELDVELAVFDLAGRRVRTLVDGPRLPGEQAASWDGTADDGRRAPAGVYVVRLRAGGAERTIRVLVAR